MGLYHRNFEFLMKKHLFSQQIVVYPNFMTFFVTESKRVTDSLLRFRHF